MPISPRIRPVALAAVTALGASLLATVPASGTPDVAASPAATAAVIAPTTSVATAAAARAPRGPRLRVRTVVRGLQQPWDVQQVDRRRLLVTERDRARLSLVVNGKRRTVRFPRDTVWVSGETGLMSLALARDFAKSRRFSVCHGGHRAGGSTAVVVSSYRLRLARRAVAGRRVLLDRMPASSGRHGGCRLLTDRRSGALWVGTGDSATTGVPRDLDSLGGKVLRLDPTTGAPWPANPYAAETGLRRYVVTYGHRNVQGLAQRRGGRVWSVEHGSYRDDEVNLLRAGGDYGWEPGPGYDESVPMTDSSLPGHQVRARWRSGRPTVATSGAAWVHGKGWGRLRGTLAVAALKGSRVLFMKFSRAGRLRWVRQPRALKRFGRLRSVTSTPRGDLLITTANGSNDRILRVRPRRR